MNAEVPSKMFIENKKFVYIKKTPCTYFLFLVALALHFNFLASRYFCGVQTVV